MAAGEKKPPAHENRWWVDQGKNRERLRPDAHQSPVGASFFRCVEGYDQEQACTNLTDLNPTLLAQAKPVPGEWTYLPLTVQRSTAKEIDKVKRALPLPPDACGVLVDAGLSLRAIITGTPVNERILEFNFIDEASFDCWIRGEWVREEVYDNKHQLLQHAADLLHRYLGKTLLSQESFFDAPHTAKANPFARTDW